jgi:hypothetical protein
MYQKKILDLGCGQADISGALYRLGGEITAVDARQEHLTIAQKKFAGIKLVKADLDQAWPFANQKFDIILDLAVLCHVRDYEKHLTAICSMANYIVLETGVCDSDDPNKCVVASENKGIYDNSINGISSHPSPAAVERVLTNCGMTFSRMDSAKLNAKPFVYDWPAQNNGDYSIGKRRLWFANRADNPVVKMPVSVPYTLSGGAGHQPAGGLLNSHQSTHSRAISYRAPPRPPQTRPTKNPPLQPYLPKQLPSFIYQSSKEFSLPMLKNINPIKESSRRFSVLTPEKNLTNTTTFPFAGTVFPLTASSRLWFKKAALLFPEMKADRRAIGLQGFPTGQNPDIIMCSVDNLHGGNRVWIEEWFDKKLTDQDLNILRNSGTIMTPSLINAQEILQAIPTANIIKILRPWPYLNVEPIKNNFLYFEKNEQLTELLLAGWQSEFGKLIVVGSSIKLADFATHVSDCEDYQVILQHVMGCRAVIDLNYNTYYKSGILDLVQLHNIPIITNNTWQLDYDLTTLIPQDKVVVPYPNPGDINYAINKFIANEKPNSMAINSNYNDMVYETIKKMAGM